jgi:AraC-like DNA-binding protein
MAGHASGGTSADTGGNADVPASVGADRPSHGPAARRYAHAEEPAGTQPDRTVPHRDDRHQIAQAANISPRYLHKIFQDAELTPMQMLKRMRLEECRRSLQDPALAMMPIGDIISVHGYLRPDQFARDFRQMFGVSAKQVHKLTKQRPSGREG